MKFCHCGQPVFGKGFCKSHQYERADYDKRSILQRGIDKQKQTGNNRKVGNSSAEFDIWFDETHKKLTGTCQCGCGSKSQKNNPTYWKFSCCHLFPKSKFHSIKTHPLNYVERAFFGGCHSVLDDTSMDRWVGMADWDNIKAKFYILAPLITKEEKATKFYSKLEFLVINN